MPRKNRRPQRRTRQTSRAKGSAIPDNTARLLGLDANYSREDEFDGGWHVRQIASWRAVKDYTCPNCLRRIPPGQSHIVAWRADWIFGDEDAGAQRRHWHTGCWRNRQQDMR